MWSYCLKKAFYQRLEIIFSIQETGNFQWRLSDLCSLFASLLRCWVGFSGSGFFLLLASAFRQQHLLYGRGSRALCQEILCKYCNRWCIFHTTGAQFGLCQPKLQNGEPAVAGSQTYHLAPPCVRELQIYKLVCSKPGSLPPFLGAEKSLKGFVQADSCRIRAWSVRLVWLLCLIILQISESLGRQGRIMHLCKPEYFLHFSK